MKSAPLAAIVAMALIAPAVAQAPALPPAPRAVKVPGVSPAGNAVLTRFDGQDDPQLRQLIVQQKGVRDQMMNTVMTANIDVDRIAGLLQRIDALSAQIRQRQSARVIAMLRALPAADRGPFLRAAANPGTAGRPAP